MFERFTDRSRRVLVLSQEEASFFLHDFIGTEHILLGLIREGEGVAAQALAHLDVNLEAVRRRVDAIVGRGRPYEGSPPFTPRAKRVLELALREAVVLDHNYIGTEHLLLGVIREGNGIACQVLADLGVSGDAVRAEVGSILREFSGPLGPPKIVTLEPRAVTGRPGRTVSTFSLVPFASCGFCDRRPPETGRLVGRGQVAICEHCIREWADRLRPESTEPPDGGTEGGGEIEEPGSEE